MLVTGGARGGVRQLAMCHAKVRKESKKAGPPYSPSIWTAVVDVSTSYFLVVKSISLGLYPPSAAFSHVQAPRTGQYSVAWPRCPPGVLYSPAGREPQAQLAAGFTFSEEALSQVHSPAGRARQEQRGPETAFSLAALSQEQCRADCLPQEHLACWAVC